MNAAFTFKLCNDKGHPDLSLSLTHLVDAVAVDDRTLRLTFSGKQSAAPRSTWSPNPSKPAGLRHYTISPPQIEQRRQNNEKIPSADIGRDWLAGHVCDSAIVCGRNGRPLGPAAAYGHEGADDIGWTLWLACGQPPDGGNEMSSKPTCTLLGHLPDLRTAIRLGRVLVDL
ncbi:hypothetical protein [Mesorhizobium sp. f-mel]